LSAAIARAGLASHHGALSGDQHIADTLPVFQVADRSHAKGDTRLHRRVDI
jgi:hypothetical protein